MNFKEKAERFKAIMKDFDKLEKSVQAKLMDVADKMAPMVQGGKVAPKSIRVPEPTEYPDIKETVVPMNMNKHQLEQFADQFLKSDWHPVAKTQKNPSTEVPFEEKPTHRDYIAPTHNVSAHMQSLRDGVHKGEVKKDSTLGSEINSAITSARGTDAPTPPPAPPPAMVSSIQGAFGKADINVSRFDTSPIKPPSKNIPDEPKKR